MAVDMLVLDNLDLADMREEEHVVGFVVEQHHYVMQDLRNT